MSNSDKPQKGDIYYNFKHDPSASVENYAYEVLGISFHTETQEILVDYKPLYGCAFAKEHQIDSYVRPLKMFMEEVERDGYKGPRFIKVTDPDIVRQIKEKNEKSTTSSN